MSSLLKLRVTNPVNWVSLLFRNSTSISSKSNLYVTAPLSILQWFRFCSTETEINSINGANLGELAKKSNSVRREAQNVLLEYFYYSRNLQFMDAENMSKNAPIFFEKLSNSVEIEGEDIERSMNRYLGYHPINEFEPFFESIGLSPSVYSSFPPQNSMFLYDDSALLKNYYALCEYGVARNMIGKIYIAATEIFRDDNGFLRSKLQCFEDLGFTKSFVVKLITSSPYLLRRDVNQEFVVVEVVRKLKNAGIGYNWLEDHLSVEDSYNWINLLDFISLLSFLGVREKQLGELMKKHPDMLLVQSGGVSVNLFVLLLKFGFTPADIQKVFLTFPNISVVKFRNNIFQCYEFLLEVEMDFHAIGSIMRSHLFLLGSCKLKQVCSLLSMLRCGKKHMCKVIMDDPIVLKKWVLREKVDPLPDWNSIQENHKLRTEFLLNLGFVENSKEMKKALKVFRGKVAELQERFDCLVSSGMSREEAIKMVKVSPHILGLRKEVIKSKIQFYATLGYSVSDIATHPASLTYGVERIKYRLLVYKWLRSEGVVKRKLGFNTLLSCSEDVFLKKFVNPHPRGIEVCERVKKQVYSF